MRFKNKFQIFPKKYLPVAGVLLLLLLAAFLLWFGNSNSNQASGVIAANVYFDGEYRIADGDWQPIEEGKHIPATKGDVTMRIHFHLMDPDGNPLEDQGRVVPIALYTDHIGLAFYSGGREIRVIDNENPIIGESACGESWVMHPFQLGGAEQVEIVVRNPHRFGNDTAIDDMLARVEIWGNTDFEKDVMNRGEPQRNAGMLLMLVSLVFLGIALFSSLIHIKSNRVIWLLGLVVLFAGAYIAYSAEGVSFWSDSVVSNTIALVCSMMFYMLFLSMSIVYFLRETKKIGYITVILLAIANAVFLLLPIIGDVLFYDTQIFWVAAQILANAVLLFCLVKEFIGNPKRERWLCLGVAFPLFAFAVDVVGTWKGTWQGGLVSQYVFVVLFAVAMVMVLRLIPHSINATTKARELEMEKRVLNAELAESRIATMMSQIRPHFIYNTLGSIEQLCKLDPAKAGDLVHNFAKYLRGNFGELDNPKPILMSQEMEHVHHYINIENVRFPDMTFTFEMNSDDFRIPALTVQPIVENAIKHGLMKLPCGGTIRVEAYETDSAYCVSVVDDGAGFDTNALLDDRKHVGIRNIRERLKVMVNGTLEIESTVGVGTKVLITIPKEV
jgi:hypothetical protein